MTQKMTRREDRRPPAASDDDGAREPLRRQHARMRWAVLFAVLVTVAAASGWFWQRNHELQELRAALPTQPALAGKPAVLGERLAAAERLAQSPKTLRQAVEELGRLYHANGYHAEAETCWRLLSEHQPDEPRWWYYRAILRLAANDHAEATVLLRETLSRAPDYSPANLQLANLQLKTGDPVGAERNYRRRLELLPGDPYARLGLVRLALQKQHTAEARTLLEELIKDAPNFATAHSLYAEILAAAGDEAGARWQRWLGVETIRYTEPEDPWVDELQPACFDYDRLCVLGSIQSMREHRDRAKTLFERAIELNPAEFDAYQLLSALYFKEEQPAQARALLEQARPRLVPPNPIAWFTYVCRAYRMLEQPAEAERVIREGLTLNNDSPELLESLGLALADRERHIEAVAAYEAALRRNPNDANINYNLAVSLLALQRLDAALAALDRSLTLQPTFPPTLLLRGRIEMAAGHWEEAEARLRPLVESHPEQTEARRLLAEWHRHMGAEAEKRGAAAEAERHYRDGLALDPDSAELNVGLGAFYLVHRRFADAIAPLESHHRLRPASAPGCLFLGQAYAATGRRDDARQVLMQGAELAERAGNTRTLRACHELLQRLP